MINVSNHPSSKWGKKQLEEARKWGSEVITDIPFPNIPPEATTEEVEELAIHVFNKLVEIRDSAVHVMGEMGFTYALIQRLSYSGYYTVVHSTTERKVTEELVDGIMKKKVEFEFVKFRAYY